MRSRKLEFVREMNSEVSGIRSPARIPHPGGIASITLASDFDLSAPMPGTLVAYAMGLWGMTPPPRNRLEQFPKLERRVAEASHRLYKTFSNSSFLTQHPCRQALSRGWVEGWGGWVRILGGGLASMPTPRAWHPPAPSVVAHHPGPAREARRGTGLPSVERHPNATRWTD